MRSFLTVLFCSIFLHSEAVLGIEHEIIQFGRKIVPPAPQADTGLKSIPDAAHPFRAPGLFDRRGPCPGLNTMANHGYLPRNGIASFEQIVVAAGEAFNMDRTLSSFLAGVGMLARGNPLIDLVSIGLPSPLVPALPGHLDGPVAKGLAAHNRFEGDVSMTRQDAAVGNFRNFQPDLFAVLLDKVAQFGNDSEVTGPKSIVNLQSMQEFKFQRFIDDQKKNPELEFHQPRFTLSYGENAFTLLFFANGTNELLSVPIVTSFFQNQRFPENWHRRSSPGNFSTVSKTLVQILRAHPVSPGANDANGAYVADPPSDANCAIYNGMAGESVPGVLVNTTGLLKENVDTLLTQIHNAFPNCSLVIPHGQAGG